MIVSCCVHGVETRLDVWYDEPGGWIDLTGFTLARCPDSVKQGILSDL